MAELIRMTNSTESSFTVSFSYGSLLLLISHSCRYELVSFVLSLTPVSTSHKCSIVIIPTWLLMSVRKHIRVAVSKVFYYTFYTFWNVGLSVFKKKKKKEKKEKKKLINFIQIYPLKIIGL